MHNNMLMLFGYCVDGIETPYYLVAINIQEAFEDATKLAGKNNVVSLLFIVADMIHIDFARELARIDKEFKDKS